MNELRIWLDTLSLNTSSFHASLWYTSFWYRSFRYTSFRYTSFWYTWGAIVAMTLASVVGDVLLSRAMKQVGDVHELWSREGLWRVLARTLGNPSFFCGVMAMAVAFFSLLFGLSWGDVSLIGPAAASLTFIGNAFAAKIFLREKVDRRRWIVAVLVAGGVALLAR